MKFDDAFISYGRADSKAFATKLNEKLKSQGLNTWFDQEDIPLAVDFQEQINDGISKAHNFLFIIAPHSVNSPYCLKEIELAVKLNKRIIPLLHVEQINYETWKQRNPNKTEEDWETYQQKGLHSSFINIHPEISKINWVYFREEIDDFESSCMGLLSAISKHQDYVEKHTHFLLQALQWSRNQQQTNYLLVGEERDKAEKWLQQKFIDEQPPCIPTDLHCEFICESIKNANNLLTQVFIASSEQDHKIKEKIRKTLMRESITVWTNKTDIKTGSEFQEAINQGIEAADNFVYLISEYSLKSEYCQQEVNLALASNKRIISLLIENIDLELIPAQLKKLQFIDFTDSEKPDKYQLSADKLLQEFKKEPSYYATHKMLLVKARKWQRQNKNPSLLLRGYNLQYFEAWLRVAENREDYPPLPLQSEFIDASLNESLTSSLEVFISYSRTDSDLARKLNDALQEIGKRTWFDQESIATGTDFQKEIYRGIEISENFVFIISPKSVNSRYCGDEVEYAQKLNKRIITILYRPLSADDQKKLPPALAAVQWLDFNQHGGEFYANFNELVRTLNTDREHIRNHTKWSQRALEWQEKDKNPDLLLRGSEFAIAEEWLKIAKTENKNPPSTELQKELIDKSREAIEAREKQDKRQILVLRSSLITALVLLLGSIVTSIFAISQHQEVKKQLQQAAYNQAESFARYSLSLLNEGGKDLEAIVTAIKAGKTLQSQNRTNPEILNALQTLVFAPEFKERNRLKNHQESVNSIAISPHSKILVSGSWDNTIKLWNLETGEEIRTLQGHNDSVSSVSISPDGKILVSGSWDKTIKLWNLETGEEIRTLKGHNNYVNSLSISPDGKILASGSHDNTIKLWNLKTGEEIRTLQGHNYYVNSVSISPDGKILASGSSDKTIKLWNLETGEVIRTLQGHNYWVNSVSISPDVKILASGSSDKTIKLWNLETGEVIRTLKGHNDSVTSLSISSNGKTLTSGSNDNSIKLWNLETGEAIRTIKGHNDSVSSVSLSPDGKTVASGSWDNTIKLWNLETGEVLHTLKRHNDSVNSVSISPDGKILASGSSDKTIKLWNLETGEVIRTLQGHNYWVNSVSISPDVKILASGSSDKTIKLWNLETGEVIRTLQGHNDSVNSVSISSDGKILASGSSDKTIKLWNLETGEVIRTLQGHNYWVNSVSISPDGKILASGSWDNTIKLWNWKTGELIRTLTGHNSYINSVSISPDGKTLTSGSNDNTIKLWNIETGEVIRSLIGHHDSVNSIGFTPDGKTLVSGSRDKTIKLWSLTELDLKTLLGKNCDFVRFYLKNSLLKNNPDISEIDRNLCDDLYWKR